MCNYYVVQNVYIWLKNIFLLVTGQMFYSLLYLKMLAYVENVFAEYYDLSNPYPDGVD